MSTERPYTDDDLRAEAARKHAALTEDPDFMGIGEAMEDSYVYSTVVDQDPEELTGSTWGELLPHETDSGAAFNEAQRKIHDLITGAADTSDWAIALGADGLEPADHTIQLGVDPGDGDRPRVRLHFAFAPDMSDEDRERFVMRLGKAITENL